MNVLCNEKIRFFHLSWSFNPNLNNLYGTLNDAIFFLSKNWSELQTSFLFKKVEHISGELLPYTQPRGEPILVFYVLLVYLPEFTMEKSKKKCSTNTWQLAHPIIRYFEFDLLFCCNIYTIVIAHTIVFLAIWLMQPLTTFEEATCIRAQRIS